MYIFRIVIDANVINTRNQIAAMNQLEALHSANIVEIFRTTTLSAEFQTWPQGRDKAKRFAEIGGAQVFCSTDGRVPDSRWGSGLESQFDQLHELIFGPGYPADEKKRISNFRDALHVDQAILNEADFFVTNDRAILSSSGSVIAAGFPIHICTAEDCLQQIENFYSAHYKTKGSAALAAILADQGPILLGSNSVGSFEIVEANGDVLMAIAVADGLAALSAQIRTSTGKLSLSIVAKQSATFLDNDSAVFGHRGPSPLLVGDKSFRDFGITVKNALVLSGRVLKCHRILISSASLFDHSGKVAARIFKERFELSGAGLQWS